MPKFDGSYPDANLIPSLARSINHEESDVRWAAIMALEAIGGSEIFNLLLQRLLVEDNDDTIFFLQETIQGS